MSKFEVREVVLKNGEKISGTVIPLYPAKLLVQTDEMCLELSETEIQSLDGKKDFCSLIEFCEKPIRETIEIRQYNENGTTSSWSKQKGVNNSEQVLVKLGFLHRRLDGKITSEDKKHFESLQYFDSFGNLLPITVEKEMEDGWEFSVEFVLPVAPGEPYEITTKQIGPMSVTEKKNSYWHIQYPIRHTGRGTIYTLISIFPKGAEVFDVTPESLRRFDFNGKPVITWKRYMPVDEPMTFEAKYKLD